MKDVSNRKNAIWNTLEEKEVILEGRGSDLHPVMPWEQILRLDVRFPDCRGTEKNNTGISWNKSIAIWRVVEFCQYLGGFGNILEIPEEPKWCLRKFRRDLGASVEGMLGWAEC